jgi:hypothetical protein
LVVAFTGVLIGQSLPPEVDEDSAEVVSAFLDPVVQRSDVLAIEEPEYALLSWLDPFPGMISTSRASFATVSSNDCLRRPFDLIATVVNLVQIQLELHRLIICQTALFEPKPTAMRRGW